MDKLLYIQGNQRIFRTFKRYVGFYPRPSYNVVDQFLQLLPYNFLFFGSHITRGSFFYPKDNHLQFNRSIVSALVILYIKSGESISAFTANYLSELCYTDSNLFTIDIPLLGVFACFAVLDILCEHIVADLLGVFLHQLGKFVISADCNTYMIHDLEA